MITILKLLNVKSHMVVRSPFSKSFIVKARSIIQQYVPPVSLFEFQGWLRRFAWGNRFLDRDMAGDWSRFAALEPILATLWSELLASASLSRLSHCSGVHWLLPYLHRHLHESQVWTMVGYTTRAGGSVSRHCYFGRCSHVLIGGTYQPVCTTFYAAKAWSRMTVSL